MAPFVVDHSSVPDEVLRSAKRSLLDLIGVWVAGRTTATSHICHAVAVELWSATHKSAPLVLDGRLVSPAGAAFAGAATIDSIDAHDGYKPAKGHAGVALLPALLATIEAERLSLTGPELLTALTLGYEVACRVATVQHRSCSDYHASGSWNAVGVAAIVGRLLQLSKQSMHEALGIAEYYGPRSPMMRVIEHPTMLKDSSSWGAMTGVTAAYMAAGGFTGAPAATMHDPEDSDVWSNLGMRWLMTEQYFKRWPVCRWAQGAIAAALQLRRDETLRPDSISSITIETFREAVKLAGHAPRNSEEAQYAIAFPTACALVRGDVGVEEICGEALNDRTILEISRKISLKESAEFSAAFPCRRLTRVSVRLTNGTSLQSAVTEPPGDPENPLANEELLSKFHALATPVLGTRHVKAIVDALGPLETIDLDTAALLSLLRTMPADSQNASSSG